jgi:hypothetical protein
MGPASLLIAKKSGDATLTARQMLGGWWSLTNASVQKVR